MTIVVDSQIVSKIKTKEKIITNQDEPVADGPTVAAQEHIGNPLDGKVISDITHGESHITGKSGPVRNGPTSVVQSILSKQTSGQHDQKLDSELQQNDVSSASNEENDHQDRSSNNIESKITPCIISKILTAEKKITHEPCPVRGGPTAKAQKHMGEDINSTNIQQITEGEKLVTESLDIVKAGPTAILQSQLAKCWISDKRDTDDPTAAGKTASPVE